jgi:hypothetical protein
MLALLITFVAFIALQRVLELLLSRRHERALRAKGAYERGVGHSITRSSSACTLGGWSPRSWRAGCGGRSFRSCGRSGSPCS